MSGSSEAGVTPEELIGHLQAIATWASVGSDPIYHGIEARRCGDVEKWILEAIALIRKARDETRMNLKMLNAQQETLRTQQETNRMQQEMIQTQQEEIRRLHEMVERLESFR